MSEGLFASLYESGQPFALIDTRERRKHVDGHWFGSTNIPLSVLTLRINQLIPFRDFPIHLLDWNDIQSTAAADGLSKLGYTNVTICKTHEALNFGHGYVKGEFVWSKAFGEVVAHTSGLPEVTPAEYLANYKDALLFDVRPAAEYSQFTLPGSQSLPNSLLLANINALTHSDKTALLHCAGRTRSIIGACTLKAAGYNGRYAIFKGGTQAWQLEGHEREYNATRVYATESDDVKPVVDFLDKWHINHLRIDNNDLKDFVTEHARAHLFDVSNDAATGQILNHHIVKISGTNLIQQTDQSIARYHVPVILFDQGSGSRAAFAAFWLQLMGFTVRVVYLTEALSSSPSPPETETSYSVFATDNLLEHRDGNGLIVDFRTSRDYAQHHLTGSQWLNISEALQRETLPASSVAVVGNTLLHASETASLLEHHGWSIAGIYSWHNNDIDASDLQSSSIESPIDQSALFADRHHGNMQDSRDYLDWEEALPAQIDQIVHQQWRKRLSESTA